MIRIKIAEWLLRSIDGSCEYRLKRRDLSSERHIDGRTVMRDSRLRPVVKRLRSARVGSNDMLHIQIVASVRSRVTEGGTE